MWVVVYARIVDSKEDGVYLAGVHFGGIAIEKTEADSIARECVNNIRGGTIMPKVLRLNGRHRLPAVMQDELSRFKKIESRMQDTAQIIDRSMRRR